jgi:hypothetical protein
MNIPAACAVLLIFFLLTAGCSTTAPSHVQESGAQTPIPLSSSPVPVTFNETPAGTLAIPADPIVGTWMCYSYAGGDRLEEVYTFLANNTWIRLDRNLIDRTKWYSHGTWKNGGNNQYLMQYPVSRSSGTFQYDMVKDEFSDTFYQCTFHRTADNGSSNLPLPVLNLTLNSEQKVSRLQNNHRPFSGKIFLIVNVTIRNIHEREGYSLEDRGMHVVFDDRHEIYSDNGEMGESLENPLPFGTIAPGETRQGDVIFAVPIDSSEYSLKLVTSSGDEASNIITFKNSTK